MHLAALKGHAGIVEILCKNGANVNLHDEEGYTALILATYSEVQYPKVVEILLEHNAKPDIQNNEGNTALIRAARMGHIDDVKSLCAAHADPTLSNLRKKTALDVAKAANQDAIVKILEEYARQFKPAKK